MRLRVLALVLHRKVLILLCAADYTRTPYFFFKGGYFFLFFMYDIQHCFICRPSDSTVSEDAGIEPRTVATTTLAVRRSNHSARSHPVHSILLHFNITDLFRIRSGLNTDPDPAFYLNAGPDQGNKIIADLCISRSGSAFGSCSGFAVTQI
jgi:hypothetical protein